MGRRRHGHGRRSFRGRYQTGLQSIDSLIIALIQLRLWFVEFMEPIANDRLAGVSAFVASAEADRKSTRLNSSHGYISYAVFCLKKKKNKSHKIDSRARVRHPLSHERTLYDCALPPIS